MRASRGLEGLLGEDGEWEAVSTAAMLSELLIAVAYFVIPVQIFLFLRRIEVADVFKTVRVCFMLFIVCCGFTHMFHFISFFYRVPHLLLASCGATAVVSVTTVFVLIKHTKDLSMLLEQAAALEDAVDESSRLLKEMNTKYIRLQVLKEAAEQLAQTRQDFIATVSHEVRTPLQSILGFAELLEASPLNSGQLSMVRTLLSSARLLANIINDILDFAKYQKAEFALETEPVCLREAIERSLSIAEGTAKCANVNLRFHIGPGIPSRVLTDATRLVQFLSNVVGNGVKFTREGSVSVSLTMIGSAAQRADWLENFASREHTFSPPPPNAASIARRGGASFDMDNLEDEFSSTARGLAHARVFVDGEGSAEQPLLMKGSRRGSRQAREQDGNQGSRPPTPHGVARSGVRSDEVRVQISQPWSASASSSSSNSSSSSSSSSSKGEPVELLTSVRGQRTSTAVSADRDAHEEANKPHKQWLLVTISDTGIGIKASALELIFERFTQSDASITRKFGGTGLGLAICRQIVFLMGGTIHVESVEGEGTSFFALLPFEAAPRVDGQLDSFLEPTAGWKHFESAGTASSSDESSRDDCSSSNSNNVAQLAQQFSVSVPAEGIIADDAASSRVARGAQSRADATCTIEQLSVLVVDDNAVNCAVMLRLLRKAGVKDVVCLEDGESAVEHCADPRRLVDLILMDINMTEMDGIEATNLIRAQPHRGGLVIMAFTAALSSMGEMERLHGADFNGVLPKPCSIKMLASLLDSMILFKRGAMGLLELNSRLGSLVGQSLTRGAVSASETASKT